MPSYDGFTAKKTLTPLNAELLTIFSNARLVCDSKTPAQRVRDELAPLSKEGIDKISSVYDSARDLKSGKEGKSDIRNWIIEKLKQEIREYMAPMRSPKIPKDAPPKVIEPSVIDKILQQILHLIPQVVSSVLGKVIPLLGDAMSIFEQVKTCVQQAFLYTRTASLASLSAFALAADTIDILRSKVGEASVKSAAASLCSAASLTATIVTSGASSLFTSFANAIIEMFTFFKSIIQLEMTRTRFRRFVIECRKYKTMRLTNKSFEAWFKQSMIDIPVIAAYFVNMPLFSSPYNFLKLVDGKSRPALKGVKYSSSSKSALVSSHRLKGISHESDLSAYRALQAEAKLYIEEGLDIQGNDLKSVRQFDAARGEKSHIPTDDYIDSMVDEVLSGLGDDEEEDEYWLEDVLDSI